MIFQTLDYVKKHFNILCEVTLVEDNPFLSNEKAIALTSERYPTILQIGIISDNGKIVVNDGIALNWRMIWGLFGSMNGTCSGINKEITGLYFIPNKNGNFRFLLDSELDHFIRNFKDLRDCEGALELLIDEVYYR